MSGITGQNFTKDTMLLRNLEKLATPKPGSYLYANDKGGIEEVGFLNKIFEEVKGFFRFSNKTSSQAIGERLVTIIKGKKGSINKEQLALLIKVAKRAGAFGNTNPLKDVAKLSHKFTKIEIKLNQPEISKIDLVKDLSVEQLKSPNQPTDDKQPEKEIFTTTIALPEVPSDNPQDTVNDVGTGSTEDITEESKTDTIENDIPQVPEEMDDGFHTDATVTFVEKGIETLEVEVLKENDRQSVKKTKVIDKLPNSTVNSKELTKQYLTAWKVGICVLMAVLPIVIGFSVYAGSAPVNNDAGGDGPTQGFRRIIVKQPPEAVQPDGGQANARPYVFTPSNAGPIEAFNTSKATLTGNMKVPNSLEWDWRQHLKDKNVIIVDGIKTGKGKYTWPNGEFYEGDFVDDKRTGKGKYTWPNGDFYEGDFVDNKLTGKGKYTLANGKVYEGDFVDGKRTGKGTYTWPTGEFYEGDYVDDKRTGKGKYTWPDGAFYEGDFVDNKRTGKGKFTWPNGAFYEGDFVDDKLTGKGTYTLANGKVYEGDFVDGNLTGKG
jgi:hypothetical protein